MYTNFNIYHQMSLQNRYVHNFEWNYLIEELKHQQPNVALSQIKLFFLTEQPFHCSLNG